MSAVIPTSASTTTFQPFQNASASTNESVWGLGTTSMLINESGHNETSYTRGYQLPIWKQLFWFTFFGGMVVVSAGGNILVIWIVVANKRMRTVTNYFLVNLSIADTMVSLLNVTANFIYMLHNDWPFGTLYCKLSQFVAVLSICASVFTLIAISADRYVAIMKPLRHRLGRRATLGTATAIWVVSAAVSAPMLVFYTTSLTEDHRTMCYIEWPDGPTTESNQEYVYNVVFMVMTYFVPIAMMGYAYLRVGIELWGSQSIGECTQRQLQNIRSKRRVVKMMIVVVVIFAVCWLPFHVYFIIMSHVPDISNWEYIQEVYLFIYWLAMSNSMYNPIIYWWMNAKFRRGFLQLFSCCYCVRAPQPIWSRREPVTSRYSLTGSTDHHTRITRNGVFQVYVM